MATKNIYIFLNDANKSAEQLVTVGSITLPNFFNHYSAKDDEHQIVECISGYAVNNPYYRDLGGLFGNNIEAQAKAIAKGICYNHLSEEDTVVLNLIGVDSGSITAFWIAKMLGHIDSARLQINICAIEPTPFNGIRYAYYDTLTNAQTSTSSRVCDLSECQNINRALLIYSAEPTLSLFCSAPILPIFPPDCDLTVDALPKASYEFNRFPKEIQNSNYQSLSSLSYVIFDMVYSFLKKTGWKSTEVFQSVPTSLFETDIILQEYNALNSNISTNETRDMHYGNTIQSKQGKSFLNLHHKQLSTNKDDKNSSGCSLTISTSNATPSYRNGNKPIPYLFDAIALGASYMTYTPYSAALAGGIILRRLSNMVGARKLTPKLKSK